MTKNWYIIHTASGSEKRVKREILEEAAKQELSEYIEDVVVPTEVTLEIRKGKRVEVDKKILPGYILVKMELNDRAWHMIRKISKVSKFLGQDGKPKRISESEVQSIFTQMEEGSKVNTSKIRFENGESVKITDGPFESFTGVVMDIDEEKKRLKLSVLIFGRSTPVELEFTQVEKL